MKKKSIKTFAKGCEAYRLRHARIMEMKWKEDGYRKSQASHPWRIAGYSRITKNVTSQLEN